MKAKLIKKEYGYVLGVEDKLGTRLIAVSSQKQQEILDKLDVVCEYKLSLKNCQAIERGYDLDELAMEACDCEANECDIRDEFKAGFQKALELMGDKKFSEEDINNAMNWIMTQYFEFYEQPTTGRREHYIQSLQQTEWDVTFNPDELDADGCLILKRI